MVVPLGHWAAGKVEGCSRPLLLEKGTSTTALLPQQGARSCHFQAHTPLPSWLLCLPVSVSLLLECQRLKDSSHFLLLPLYSD